MAIQHMGAKRLTQLGHIEQLCNVNTIEEFLKTVSKLSKNNDDVEFYYGTKDDPTGAQHYKGEVGEVFGEYLIQQFKCHPAIQAEDFVPTSAVNSIIGDYGVDGVAKDADGNNVAVQFKLKLNTTSFLTSDDHLGNFYAQASTRLGIQYMADQFQSRMIIITTCQGVHPTYHEETFNNAFKVLNIQSIRQLVDGNTMFWKGFEEACKNS